MKFQPSPQVIGVDVKATNDVTPPRVVLVDTDRLDKHGHLDRRHAGNFKVLTAIPYEDDAGRQCVVPPSQLTSSTDLASVPSFMWGLLAPYGRQLRPALLHDHLCARVKDSPREEWFSKRREADDFFREALASVGVPVLRRNLFWAGVTYGRYLAYRRWFAVFSGILALVSTTVTWYGLARLGMEIFRVDGDPLTTLWIFAGLALVICVGAMGARSEGPAVLLMSLVAPWIAPTAITVLMTQGVLFCVDAPLTCLWRALGRPGGDTSTGPLLTFPQSSPPTKSS